MAVYIIDVTEFTRNVTVDDTNFTVHGEGILDILMETATSHLLVQFNGGRIKGEDYANAYVQVYQTTLTAALRVWLEKGLEELQRQLLEAQIRLTEAQIRLVEAQIAAEKDKSDLYKRQIQGFDEDYKQKILKICLDAWSVGFSVAKDTFEAAGIPAPMTKTAIDDIFNDYIITDLDDWPDFRI